MMFDISSLMYSIFGLSLENVSQPLQIVVALCFFCIATEFVIRLAESIFYGIGSWMRR